MELKIKAKLKGAEATRFLGGAGFRGGDGMAESKPKLGTGARFAALKHSLTKKKGVSNPGALAAWIGRKKYGAKKMAEMSAHNRGK